jgi:hypothetical protein
MSTQGRIVHNIYVAKTTEFNFEINKLNKVKSNLYWDKEKVVL